MKSRIKNLGDYNTVRQDLQAVGGSLETLYNNIGDTAVSKATPKIMAKGCIITTITIASVGTLAYLGHKGYLFMKNRKRKILDEPNLKQDFLKVIDPNLNPDNDSLETNYNATEIKGYE